MLDTNNFNVDKSNDFILLEPNGINHIQQFHNQKLGTNGQSEMHVKQGDILHYSLEYQSRAKSKIKFKVLQKWEGIVEEFDGDFLQVRLIDLTNGGTDEEAELSIDDIPNDDISLVKEGAMFYWNIGYETEKDGQVKKTSFVKFKRLPKIDPKQFNIIHDRAKELESKMLFD